MNDYSDAYKALSHDICVELGFCGSEKNGKFSHIDLLIPSTGDLTADKFADLAFEAEQSGMVCSDAAQSSLHAALRKLFVKHLGSEKVRVEDAIYV